MINRVSPNFGSTRISDNYCNKNKYVKDFVDGLGLNQYFKITTVNSRYLEDVLAGKLKHAPDEALIVNFKTKDNEYYRVYGADLEADEFIYRKIKQADPDAKYTPDAPKTDFGNQSVIDLD